MRKVMKRYTEGKILASIINYSHHHHQGKESICSYADLPLERMTLPSKNIMFLAFPTHPKASGLQEMEQRKGKLKLLLNGGSFL
jgi:hypothetical protein